MSALRDQNGSPAVVRVLVIEDEALVRMAISMYLKAAGFEVCGEAATAADALDLASSKRPNAAVVDIRLGAGSDGIALAKKLNMLHACHIVFVSGSAERATFIDF